MVDTFTQAREAGSAGNWDVVLDELGAASKEELGGSDLDLLAEAYWWTGSVDKALEMYEQAVQRFEGAGERAEAALVAAKLAYLAFRRRTYAVAGGWVARTEELLDGEPESVAHGWLLIMGGVRAMQTEKDWDAALGMFDEAKELARRLGDRGIEALAKSFTGFALIQKGEWVEGIKVADEATLIALSAKSDRRATGDVYCNTIALCRDLGDYRRATEWTEEAERWMRSHSVAGYPGVCQVHRAELKRLKGKYEEAESDARRACVELERFHLLDAVGFAHNEIGEARRRMGDLEAAEEEFDKAYEYGIGSQPGRALLLLERGDVEGAARSIALSLERIDSTEGGKVRNASLSRGRLLPAQVEIALERGDIETAESALSELESIAEAYEAVSWQASVQTARGEVELAKGHPAEAIESLNTGWRLWRDIDLPYESAAARTKLGRAKASAGDDDGARLEFTAAKAMFSDLGAATDVRRLNELLGVGSAGSIRASERIEKTFVFTDIVTSTDLLALIGDSAWEDLLAWHDRVIRETLADAGGQEVNHTGDGFFVAFDSARVGIDWAVSVQRRLAKHRREHGFAPEVRIGLHHAEATRRGRDYSGQGVHIASRIADSAGAGEIRASGSAVHRAGATPYATTDLGNVELKGILDPVGIQVIGW